MSEWLNSAANVLKGLTLRNVAILALILACVVPVFVIWKVFSDPALLDRFLSSYRVVRTEGGCTIRVVAERGASEQWSISTGWAAGGNERWIVGVILDRGPPSEELIASHCATLQLIVQALPSSAPQ
jgi:hypothetical protein